MDPNNNSASIVRLVLIGDGIDVELLQENLRNCCAPLSNTKESVDAAREKAKELLATDDRFDLWDSKGDSTEEDTMLYFRMTTCRTFNITERDLARTHGVNLNNVQIDFIERVNYANGGFFVNVKYFENDVYIRYDLAGQHEFQELWFLNFI